MSYIKLKNRILVTGANGNLASQIIGHLQCEGIELSGASSKPRKDQILLDFSQPASDFDFLDSFDVLIHCGRVIDLNDVEAVRSEQKFLAAAFQKKCKVIYIGSTSAWLSELSKYGDYKLRLSDFVYNNHGIVISAGLIYGRNFKGQLYSLGKVLNKLPFTIQLIPSSTLYLTPVEKFCSVIIERGLGNASKSHYLVAHSSPVSFNEVLEKLSKRSIGIKVKVRSDLIRCILKILNLKNSYFNADSILGLMSSYDMNSLEKRSVTHLSAGVFARLD
jgi:hypothetical protein